MTAIREITKVKPGGTVEVSSPVLVDGEEVGVIVLLPSDPGFAPPVEAWPAAEFKTIPLSLAAVAWIARGN